MLLDRKEFIDAGDFLKPVITTTYPKTWRNYIHVKVDGVVCQLTTGSHFFGKRVTLEQPDIPIDMEEPDKPQREAEYGDYLIDFASFEGFLKMCQVHKKDLAKAARNDLELNFIDIFNHRLESHDGFVDYNQPVGVTFGNLDNYFRPQGTELKTIKADTDYIFEIMKKFSAMATIHLGDSHVYIETDGKRYEAFFKPSYTGRKSSTKCPDYSCQMQLDVRNEAPHIYIGKNWTTYVCKVCGSKIIKLSDYPGDIPRIEIPTLLDFKAGIR